MFFQKSDKSRYSVEKATSSLLEKLKILIKKLNKTVEGTQQKISVSLADQFTQTRALVYSEGDAVQQAKVLSEAAQKLENLKILAGILIGENKTSILNRGEVEALSKLPSREELIVKLLFLMQAPATQFVRTLNAVPAKFVRTLAAIRDSK